MEDKFAKHARKIAAEQSMELRRIVISLQQNDRRIILYPEGGLEIEMLVDGQGWVIDTHALYGCNPTVTEADLGALLALVKATVDNAADHFQGS